MTAHSRKEFAESRAAISEPDQNNADHAGAEKHGGKHQDARHFWHGLATQEVRCGDKQRASPGYGERQRKVTGDGVALQESFALEGIAHGLNHIPGFAVLFSEEFVGFGIVRELLVVAVPAELAAQFEGDVGYVRGAGRAVGGLDVGVGLAT